MAFARCAASVASRNAAGMDASFTSASETTRIDRRPSAAASPPASRPSACRSDWVRRREAPWTSDARRRTRDRHWRISGQLTPESCGLAHGAQTRVSSQRCATRSIAAGPANVTDPPGAGSASTGREREASLAIVYSMLCSSTSMR